MAEASHDCITAVTPYPAGKPASESQFLNLGGWAVQILVAIILAQTLFFKFTYAPETQAIFASRGGRPVATAIGMIELICAILLLTPRASALGALISLAVISGAIFTHLTSLGIAIVDPTTGQSDRGLLFGLALTVAIGSVLILWKRWQQLQRLRAWFVAG